jgi:hypothetical protein
MLDGLLGLWTGSHNLLCSTFLACELLPNSLLLMERNFHQTWWKARLASFRVDNAVRHSTNNLLRVCLSLLAHLAC